MMAPHEPNRPPLIQGYELLEKLGAGGYGEVWSARVPGGMTKAVKIIYGRQDESRAANELKSLERVREVRHPFVVTIERVEFIEGRVVVVSELADGSLRDRFRDCAAQGMSGIPRDELLGYLKDVADALDFLTHKHELQHLDIKPENLLLLAGHAKVADFGLVKSVGDKTQSLVGGMTPAYAPPEVFQGMPSQQSDQYSLAVLYQEMLTGFLPFSGDNAAELTLQHLHDDPDLSALSEADRFSVSRALSKNPEHRFETCSAFVTALVEQESFAARPASASPRVGDTQPLQVTEVFDEEPVAKPGSPIKIALPPVDTAGEKQLPTPEGVEARHELSPAMFIGVGGTAGRVLRELRLRMSERFKLTGPLPAMPMLLLDTDPQSLVAASRNASRGAGLTQEETVALPLRRPQEYREKSASLLRWLGRRWLYNIPKSLRTEGIRPLGRLALVDHARQAIQRIRRAMSDCLAPESIEATNELTGLNLGAGPLRVYVVASTSGGTGGGMSLDVAYAVRTLLDKLGVKDAKIIGVMTASTGRDRERGELARVNSFAWIAEHQHYCQPGNAYQGDAGCGLPEQAAGVRPFDDTYLVHLGDRLDEASFTAACQSVADYLYLDATTAVQPFLDRCRKLTGEKAAEDCCLRTFSVRRLEAAPAEARVEAEQLVVNQLLDSWLGGSDPDDPSTGRTATDHIVLGAGELVGKLKLDPVNLATNSRGMIEAALQNQALAQPTSSAPLDRLEEINANFAAPADSPSPLLGENTPSMVCGLSAAQMVEPVRKRLEQAVCGWIAERVDQPCVRLRGGLQSAKWFREHAETLLRDLHRFADATRQKLGEVVNQAASQETPVPDLETRYMRLQVDLLALECAAQITGGIRGAIAAQSEGLMQLKPALAQMLHAARSQQPCDPCTLDALPLGPGTTVPKLVQSVDVRLQEEWLREQGGLQETLRLESARRDLVGAIRRVTQQTVREALLSSVAERGDHECRVDWITPPLAEFGNGLFAAVVNASSVTQPGPQGLPSWRTDTPDGDGYQIVEAQQVSARHAAAALVGYRRDYADFAERVHSRRDVMWTDLLAPKGQKPAALENAFTVPVVDAAAI